MLIKHQLVLFAHYQNQDVIKVFEKLVTLITDLNLNQTIMTSLVNDQKEICFDTFFLVGYPDGYIYQVTEDTDFKVIIDELINHNHDISTNPYFDQDLYFAYQLPHFENNQYRLLMHNCGQIDPTNILDYIKNDGYLALGKVLTTMSQQQVIATLISSGLKEKTGLLVGVKWNACYHSDSDQKYIIASAGGTDPGDFTDRLLLESDPHTFIEALIIGAYAIGASKGIINISYQYHQAIQTVKTAIDQCYQYGFLGSKLFNTDFNFDLEIRLGSGTYVSEDERALIAEIEGRRANPRNMPPYPTDKGIWNYPTIINDLPTLGKIPLIILEGASWYQGIGTPKAKGTFLCELNGKISRPGLYELCGEITLHELINQIGGGIKNSSLFKAALIGGVSGIILTKDDLNQLIDDQFFTDHNLKKTSVIITIFDQDDCMVELATYLLKFMTEESCGKCAVCREGTLRILETLKKIEISHAEIEDIDAIEEMAHAISDASLCHLGRGATYPVLATIKHFKDEYINHIIGQLHQHPGYKAYLITDKCIGCGRCRRVCPVSCITGVVKQKHVINTPACIMCGSCESVCNFKAVILTEVYDE